MPYSISPISSRHSSLASSSIHNHKFPPANSLYQLAGKSNFQLWLSAIKPYLFSNIESTGLILGGWAEPKPGPNPWSKPTAPTTGEDDPTSTSEHWDRERWTAANTETCRFIRGTLAMNVIPHVRQHHTAKALWHNLLWLYGEEAGIDTQGGPSGPVSGPPESANSNGNENLSARNRKGGNGNRSKLLAALAAKNSTAVEFDLDVNVATPASSSSRPMLPPVTKTFGVGSPSKSYGAFLEVPSFDGPEEQAEQDEEGEDFEDDIADNAPKNSVVNNAPTPNPVIVTITESTTHSKNGISKGKETSTPLGQTTSQQILPKPSTPESQVKDNTATNLSTVHEDEEAVHPGRRVDLSDSSALIRYHHRRSMSISHLPHPSRERDAKKKYEHVDDQLKDNTSDLARKRLSTAVGGFKRFFFISPTSSTHEYQSSDGANNRRGKNQKSSALASFPLRRWNGSKGTLKLKDEEDETGENEGHEGEDSVVGKQHRNAMGKGKGKGKVLQV